MLPDEPLPSHNKQFKEELSKRYLSFALKKQKQKLYRKSGHYRDKSVRLSEGEYMPFKNPMKEIPNNDHLSFFMQGYAYLSETLTPNITSKYPIDSAKAQFYFDCWMEEFKEDRSSLDTYRCKELFYRYLDIIYQHINNEKDHIEYAVLLDEQELKENYLKSKAEQIIYENINSQTSIHSEENGKLLNLEEEKMAVKKNFAAKETPETDPIPITNDAQLKEENIEKEPLKEDNKNQENEKPKQVEVSNKDEETKKEASQEKELIDLKQQPQIVIKAPESLIRPTYYVYFPVGKADLDEAATLIVRSVAEMAKKEVLNNCRNCFIKLGGHSDKSGSDKVNILLSMKRAKAVEAELIKQGIDTNIIHTAAYGSDGMPISGKLLSGRFVKIVLYK